MRFWSILRIKSIYAKIITTLVLSVLLLGAEYLFLHAFQRGIVNEVQAQMTEEFGKRFDELLHNHDLHLSGYLQSSAHFNTDIERFEAMWTIWERLLMGINGIKYDSVMLFDQELQPIAHHCFANKIRESELLKAIPHETLSLEAPRFSSYFTRLSDGRIVHIFSAPLLEYVSGLQTHRNPTEEEIDHTNRVYGYAVAVDIWSSEYIGHIDRLSGQNIALLTAKPNANKYDMLHPLKDFYGNDIAFLGVNFDNRFAKIIERAFSSQMILVGFISVSVALVSIFLVFVLVLRPLKKLSDVLHFQDKKILTELLDKEDEFGDMAKVVQQSLKQSALLEQLRGAINTGFIVSKGDLKGNITYANDQFCRISGYSREELLGRNHNIVRHPDNNSEFFGMMWKRISSGKVWNGVLKNRAKNGEDYYVRALIVPLMDENGRIEEYLSIRTDITELYEQMQMIVSQTTDLLTGLPNKQRLLQDLEAQTCARCLIFLDINQFYTINDSFGEQAGDRLLIEFVRRLESIIPIGAELYRLGGDEFAILIDEASEPEEFATALSRNLEEHPFAFAGSNIILRVRIASACGIDLLYQKCDMAMNYAKTNNFTFVDFSKNSQIRDELDKTREVMHMIQEAIHSDFIQAYGQKIVSVKDPSVFKIETLMRIVDNNGKVTSPFIFLEQAKNARLYSKLTRMMMKRVFDHFTNKHVEFSINLTFEDLQDSETTRLVLDTMRELELGQYVTIELVESEHITLNDAIRGFIQEAKLLGCKISLDDFGSGYSNFDYILRIGADIIKIDGSLIRDIDSDKNSYLTVKTIVSLAKELGILTVAEFIHSQEVMDVVVSLGVDYLQGYHLHQPEELGELLAKI